MAVGKKTGGRVKGTPNKAPAAKVAEIAASGLTPLEYMLQVLRAPESTSADRAWAAKEAAPYCHSRLAAIQHTGKDGGPIETHEVSDKPLSDDEWAAKYATPN